MHQTLSAVVVVSLAAGGAACGTYRGGDIPHNNVFYDITPSASLFIGTGGLTGYSISAITGGVYRLAWNGDPAAGGVYHHFYGSVWTPGGFADIVPGCFNYDCPVESNDIIEGPIALPDGKRIDFDAHSTGDIDGFDFQGDEPIYFDLLIDGARYGSMVYLHVADDLVGKVPQIPFGVRGTET